MTKEFFSVYRPPISASTIPEESFNLDSIWEGITDHTLKKETDKLRNLLSQNKKDEYRKQKGLLLPSVTFGGVFDYRHTDPQMYRESLIFKLKTETDPDKILKIKKTISLLEGKKGLLSSSGLVIIDIDHISETGLTLENLRDELSVDPKIGVRLIFVSPSGDGLKVVCKTSAEITSPETYRSVFNSLRYYINTTYGEIVDKSGSDITRLCLICHDPNAKRIDSEDTFNPYLHPVPEIEKHNPEHTYQDRGYPSGDDGIEEIVRRVERSGLDIAPEYGDYLKLVYSFTALGEERGKSYLHRVCKASTKYNRDKTDEDFENCLKSGNSQSIGTFVNMCKSMGIDVSTPVEKIQTQRTSRKQTPVQTKTEPTPEDLEEKYKEFLIIPDLGEVAKTKREGIKTGYKFGQYGGKKEEYLTLRSGAMTLICGKPSHCKSKLLQNLAIQISEDMYSAQEDGSVLFFTYEEELSDVLLQFANIYTNTPNLSQYGTPNTEIIQDFLTTGDSSRCTQDKKYILQRKLPGFKTLYNSGKLRVYYTDKDSQSLCELIKFLSSKFKIKAVFVDYVQLLHRENYRKERREELKDICNDLRTTAIDLCIPIVLSAQLNKEAKNPTEMSSENVADCYDLARYANTIICLWLSQMKDDVKDLASYTVTKDCGILQNRGFILGEEGKLYAKITKNRGGTPFIDSILDFVGETGCIPRSEDNTPSSQLLDIEDLPDDM